MSNSIDMTGKVVVDRDQASDILNILKADCASFAQCEIEHLESCLGQNNDDKVLLPNEPTSQMIKRGIAAYNGTPQNSPDNTESIVAEYKAMINIVKNDV